MFRAVLLSLALTAAFAASAKAACFADYKAKRGEQLELHYGVVEIRGACDPGSAATEVRRRIAQDGWELLTVVGVFDESGLEERRDNAGPYFLRY